MVIESYTGPACPPLELLEERAESEGHEFVKRTTTEWTSGVNRFDRPGECFLLASSNDEIIGMCGLNRDPYLDNPVVGRLRHLYVHPDHRRTGVAAALVGACLDRADGNFDRVRLRTANPAADRFYRSIGFESTSEQAATHSYAVRPTSQ